MVPGAGPSNIDATRKRVVSFARDDFCCIIVGVKAGRKSVGCPRTVKKDANPYMRFTRKRNRRSERKWIANFLVSNAETVSTTVNTAFNSLGLLSLNLNWKKSFLFRNYLFLLILSFQVVVAATAFFICIIYYINRFISIFYGGNSKKHFIIF